jgi:polar amino acid transport system permease protein
MFEYCSDPKTLEGFQWLSCYLTTPKHLSIFYSCLNVILLIALAAPFALAMGFAGTFAKRARFAPIRWLGHAYTSVVRGVPDIIFFLFVPIAMDQGIEYIRHKILCPEVTEPVRQGNDFVVCAIAKAPVSDAAAWMHDAYGFALAVIAFGLVLGAFAANVLDGALKSVPEGQIEAGLAMGLSRRQVARLVEIPQMWIYALPGLSNLWQLLIKATPLLFLLGIKDVVYWARELGSMKTQAYAYPHDDWRLFYFIALLGFYLFLTWVSTKGFDRINRALTKGQIFNAGGA